MIGQTNLQGQILQLINDDTFPRFSIFVGPKGSGKKIFVREFVIHELTDGLYEECGIKVDDVRELIVDAYKIHSTAVYFIPDADNMSNAAKNALLKVTEEPPNNAYFIMTLEDENNALETIRSRGTVFHMDRYIPDEIFEYYWEYAESHKIANPNDAEICEALCETPGEVELLCNMKPMDFYDYVQLVVDNIAEVQLANAFKIADKIALKDGAEGYDLKLFWKAFMKVAFDTGKNNSIYSTSKYLQKLRTKGINRQMLFDSWVLEIREYA